MALTSNSWVCMCMRLFLLLSSSSEFTIFKTVFQLHLSEKRIYTISVHSRIWTIAITRKFHWLNHGSVTAEITCTTCTGKRLPSEKMPMCKHLCRQENRIYSKLSVYSCGRKNQTVCIYRWKDEKLPFLLFSISYAPNSFIQGYHGIFLTSFWSS